TASPSPRRRQRIVALFCVDFDVPAVHSHLDLAIASNALAAIAQSVLVSGISEGGAVGTFDFVRRDFVVDRSAACSGDILRKDVAVTQQRRALGKMDALDPAIDWRGCALKSECVDGYLLCLQYLERIFVAGG